MNKNQADENSILLMSHDRIRRSVERMAYQIAEDHPGETPILIAGIKTRGFAVARLLKGYLEHITASPIHIFSVSNPENNSNGLRDEYEYIALVDDVIFSGRTMFKASNKILGQFTPEFLRTVVLVDRGHRLLPVEATFTGLNLPTKLNEHVQLHLEKNLPERVTLTKQGS